MIVEALLKICYLVGALFFTLEGIGMLFVNPLFAIGMVVGANLALRIVFEFALMIIIMCGNTSDINTKIGKLVNDKKETKIEE